MVYLLETSCLLEEGPVSIDDPIGNKHKVGIVYTKGVGLTRFHALNSHVPFRFEHDGPLATSSTTHLTDEINEEEDPDEDILAELSRKAAAGINKFF